MTGGFTGEIRRRFGYRKHHEKTETEAGVTHLLTRASKTGTNHQEPDRRPGTDSPSQSSGGTNPAHTLILWSFVTASGNEHTCAKGHGSQT